MGDVEDYFPVAKKKPYPSARKLARKSDDWEKKRKKKGKNR